MFGIVRCEGPGGMAQAFSRIARIVAQLAAAGGGDGPRAARPVG